MSTEYNKAKDRLVHEAALATEFFSEDELEEFAAQQNVAHKVRGVLAANEAYRHKLADKLEAIQRHVAQPHCQCRSGSPDTCPICTDMETGEKYDNI